MVFRSILFLSFIIGISACSKINQQNYNKLEVGLSFDSVKKLLGEPMGCEVHLGTRYCSWSEKQRHIRCNFQADRVVLYSSEGF